MKVPRMARREFNRRVAASALAGAIPELRGSPREGLPDILIVVADDLGWADVGFHGSRIPTPHLDRLAAGGLRLEQHYGAPMCSPTRAALMTGRYWSRFGVTAATNDRCLPFDTVTLAAALRQVGYDTAITGKWHLGSKSEWGPRRFGFDHSYGSLAGGVTPYGHRYKSGPYSRTWHRNDQLIEEQGHVTDLLVREAVGWIESRTQRPFFLYLPFTAPHIPMDESEEWLARNAHFKDSEQRLYGAAVAHMDHGIGAVWEAIRRKGRAGSTLVLFLSDNGATPTARNDDPQYPGTFPAGACGGSNVPLRGNKTQLYEGGIRSVALVHWPRAVKPGRCPVPLHVIDWMPTLSGLAGYRPAKDLRWDGMNVWPILTGESGAPRARALYWEGVQRRSSALRLDRWKLLVHRDEKAPRTELFDLAVDPAETRDLAGLQPNRVQELERLLVEQRARDNDAVPSDAR